VAAVPIALQTKIKKKIRFGFTRITRTTIELSCWKVNFGMDYKQGFEVTSAIMWDAGLIKRNSDVTMVIYESVDLVPWETRVTKCLRNATAVIFSRLGAGNLPPSPADWVYLVRFWGDDNIIGARFYPCTSNYYFCFPL
jgi:hypothetical protein